MLEKRTKSYLGDGDDKLTLNEQDTNIYDTRIYIWSEKKSMGNVTKFFYVRNKEKRKKNEITANQEEKICRQHFVV